MGMIFQTQGLEDLLAQMSRHFDMNLSVTETCPARLQHSVTQMRETSNDIIDIAYLIVLLSASGAKG
jgi:hypothetical protein